MTVSAFEPLSGIPASQTGYPHLDADLPFNDANPDRALHQLLENDKEEALPAVGGP